MLKNYRWTLLWLNILLFVCIVKAQERDIRGLVLVDFKDEYPEGVIVTNKRNKTYSVTDMGGTFHIMAKVGDTLSFQGDFLVDRNFTVKNSTFELNPFIVHMNYEIISLADIVVRPPLTGDLTKDIKTVKFRKDVEKVYANLGIDIRTLDIEPKERKEAIVPAITALNIEALYKSLTGYYRRMKRLNEFERLEKRLSNVKKHLGDQYFVDILQIPEEEIRSFLLFVYGNSNNQYELYYNQSDYLSIEHLLQSMAPTYKERLRQRDAAINK